MLKSPLVRKALQSTGGNQNPAGYDHVFQAWCEDYDQLSDAKFNEFLKIYEKGQGIQETDQRIVDKLLIATGSPAQGPHDPPITLAYFKGDNVVEKDLQDYSVGFCTIVDFEKKKFAFPAKPYQRSIQVFDSKPNGLWCLN